MSAAGVSGMDMLDELFARGPMRDLMFLMYAKDKIQRNQF